MQELQFDYYRGMEAEQYTFYRIPKVLFTAECFKSLSCEAKVLYGLLLDRMSLSIKNRWFDEEDRVYIIFTVEDVMELLSCSRQKAIKNLAELDSEKGIGLIEKKRRGLGKPDIIYVKNFASVPEKESEEKPANADVSTEVKNLYFKKERNLTSGSKETGLQEVKEFAPNYNNTNYNDQNHTDMSYPNPINLSVGKDDVIDGMDETSTYMALIRENLEYEHHMKYERYGEREMYEEIYETVCDVVCVKRRTIRINGEDYPYELVKSRFLKLNSGHVAYVMDCMKNTATKITNIRAYLITALYNAPSTMSHYYQQEVQHDMYGGGWAEKGIT